MRHLQNRKHKMKCLVCGREFVGTQSAKYCPDCRTERYHARTGTKVEKVCAVCGKKFLGCYGAKYCPDCRQLRREQSMLETRKRLKNKTACVIGKTMRRCAYCGKEFVITSPNNKYCPKCRKDARNALRRKSYREHVTQCPEKMARKRKATHYRNRFCAVCGTPITKNTSTSICDDPKCRKRLDYFWTARRSYNYGRRKRPPTMEAARKRFGIVYHQPVMDYETTASHHDLF